MTSSLGASQEPKPGFSDRVRNGVSGYFAYGASKLGSRTRLALAGAGLAALVGMGTSYRQMGQSCPAIAVATSQAGQTAPVNYLARLRDAGTPARAEGVIDEWKRACGVAPGSASDVWSAPARHNLWWDFFFILFYTTAGCLLVGFTARLMSTSILRLFGFLSTVFVVGGGLLDVFENMALFRMLGGATGWPWPPLTRWFATFKVSLLAGASLYVAVAALVAVVRWRRNVRGGYEPQARGAQRNRENSRGRDDEATSVPTAADQLDGADGIEATFAQVAQRELDYLVHHRRNGKDPDRAARTLVGLALSGGGIRAATTSLGVLQALARMQILPFVDYLSSVSGGGYIASCLTSLLSLNKQRLPGSPPVDGATSPGDLHLFAAGNVPAFSTGWNRFPFRDDRDTREAHRAIELIAHLRTHGTFLIARRGILTRDTLRAIGNILTGIVFHVAGFIIALFALTALYLTAVTALSPGVQGELFPPLQRAEVMQPSVPRFAVTDSAVTRETSASCDAASPDCQRVSKGAMHLPTVGAKLRYQFGMLLLAPRLALAGVDDSVASTVAAEPRTQPRAAQDTAAPTGMTAGTSSPRTFPRAVVASLRVTLLSAAATGALASLLALGAMALALALFRNSELLAPPLPGEAQEEVFDKSLLWLFATLTAGLAFAATLAFRQHDMTPPALRLITMWIPLVVFATARLVGFLTSLLLPLLFASRLWSRRTRTLWGGYQALLVYAVFASIVLLVLLPLMFTLASAGPQLALGSVASLGVARLLTPSRSPSPVRARIPTALLHLLLAIAVVLVIVLGVLAFGALLIRTQPTADYRWWLLGALGAMLVVGWLVDVNKLGLHYFYRDRLAETYLLSELPDTQRRRWTYRDSMEMPLRRLHGDVVPGGNSDAWRNTSPYHLVSAAINLSGSRELTRKDRKSGYWLFSKLYCGSTHTGFRPTAIYRGGETKLSRALAISGAAASSAMGFHTFFAQAFATVLFNVRLGYWTENPRGRRSQQSKEGWIFWPSYIWKEVTMQTNERSALVNLSDGGHTGDNVGIYPLLQRRCKVIIAVDAEQDRTLAFGSFTEALRQANIDEGIRVDIDLSMIRPDSETGYSRSHCAVGRVLYPDRPEQASWLIYLKNSLTGDEPEPVLNYKATEQSFPHESTADQFFNDAQFESYRALGEHIAGHAFAHWKETPAFKWARDLHNPQPL